MSEHAWFKLLMRAVGILLLGLSIPSLFTYMSWLVMMLEDTVGAPSLSRPYTWGVVLQGLGYLLQAGTGAYLLFGGDRLISHCLREVRGRCAACGYDISTIRAKACPECGAPIAREDAALNALNPPQDGESARP